MSTLKVEMVAIDQVLPHPNADRLEIAVVFGWNCIVQKGRYKAGDKAIYFPIDSILPIRLEEKLFPADAKVKLHNSRIRTIKIRGSYSQGLLADPIELGVMAPVGKDLTALLGVSKYEPPEAGFGTPPSTNKKAKPKSNAGFSEYTHLQHYKRYTGLFVEGEPVVLTEKIHGTNFRAGWLPAKPKFWRKVGNFLRRIVGAKQVPTFEFCYGSHRVQLQSRQFSGFYKNNVYLEAVQTYDLQNKLQPGEVVYGEIYGGKIQKNYLYGCGDDERKLVVFDVMKDGRWLNHHDVVQFCQDRELPMVPVLYIGPFYTSLSSYTKGDSVLAPSQKVREGVVIKPVYESMATGHQLERKILKMVSDEYLMRNDTTEFH